MFTRGQDVEQIESGNEENNDHSTLNSKSNLFCLTAKKKLTVKKIILTSFIVRPLHLRQRQLLLPQPSPFSMWLCSTCGSLRGRPRSLLFDLGGRPLRLLSLLQEVNLLGSFLASRGWPPSLLFDLGGQPLRLLSLLQEVNLWGSFFTSRDWPPSLLFDLQGWSLKLSKK